MRSSLFKILPWKSKVKVMREVKILSHEIGLAFDRLTFLSFHVNRPFLGYSFFKISPWKSMVEVMDMVKLQNQCPTSYRLITFILCQLAIPWIWLFQHWKGQGHSSWYHNGSNILFTHIPFVLSQPALTFLKYSYFKIDLENPRSRSWMMWKVEVTQFAQYPFDVFPFCFTWISPSIPKVSPIVCSRTYQSISKPITHVAHPLKLVIICTKYGKNPFRTIDLCQRTWQDVSYGTVVKVNKS